MQKFQNQRMNYKSSDFFLFFGRVQSSSKKYPITSRMLYTLEDVSKHNSRESAWLAIHGKVYDVTKFLDSHPGGDLILMAAGRPSGTEFFESHHPPYVTEMLSKFYIGDVRDYQSEFSKDNTFYLDVKQRVDVYFKQNNLKRRDSITLYFKAFLTVSCWILFYFLSMFRFQNYFISFFLAIVWGWWIANMGMFVMHDGNHGGFSNSPLLNRLAGGAFDLLGGSSFVWKMIHSVGHHVHTNVEELDPDINTKEPHFRKIKAKQIDHWWYQYQHFYLLPMYTMLIFELAIRDFLAMSRGAWGGTKFQPIPTSEWILFYIIKGFYVCYNFLIPIYMGAPISKLILVYVVANMVASEILVLMFQVNHVTEIASFYNVNQYGKVVEDWGRVQVSGSSNFAAGSLFWNHLSGGLNHQIEHHLFPSISHVHYPAISHIVQKACKEYNITYNNYSGFYEAVCGHLSLLKKMGAMYHSHRPKLE
jgi:fatty acid desaturase/predicted heme/steroid binding protein